MRFVYNDNLTNVATIEDFHQFINELLLSDNNYQIEIIDSNGTVYRKLYNSGNSLTNMVLNNMNNLLQIKVYEITKKEKKLDKIIHSIFNINVPSTQQSNVYEFNLWIIDYKTKTHINTKNKIRSYNHISDFIRRQVFIQVENFIYMQEKSSTSIMYKGKELCYHNHISKAINDIEKNILIYNEEINYKTLRTYIGKQLRDSIGVITNVELHDISTNKTKGNTRYIGIYKNRWETTKCQELEKRKEEMNN